MSSFLNQKLGQTFGQTVQSLGQQSNVELRVGSHTLIVKERVAEGGFGFVDLVTEVHTKKDYVLKRCNVDREVAFATVKKEINILQRFAGPYMVELIDSDIITKNRTSREALLLLDFCPGGHLLERLNSRNGNPLPAESVFRIFGQLLLALKPLHENRPPVVHRDLKLENILFGADGKLRLIDFGSCVEGNIPISNASEREAAEEIIQKETTQMYRAPEMVDLYMRPVLTEKTDIWALGCILYALCFLKHPIQDAGPLGILSAKIVFPTNSTFSEDTHAFILKMLDVDPEARLSVAQCLECTAALAGNRPLPEHPLSSEAAQRRAERIAANELRQNKQKKVAVAAPRKVVAPLDSNSVAARRLAAKRGGGSSTPRTDLFGDNSTTSPRQPASTARQDHNKTPEFEVNFDAFPASQQSSTAVLSAKSHSNEFVDFGGGPIRAASNTISNANSLFDEEEDDDEVHAATPVTPVTSFGSNKSANHSSFDAFASDNVPVNSFDAFAPSSAAHNISSKSTHSGGFDAFANDSLVDFDTPAPAPAPVASSFNSFDDHSSFTPSTDAFSTSIASVGFGGAAHDPFVTAPVAPPASHPAKPPKPFNRRSSFATSAPVEAFDLLDVDDVSEAPRPSVTHAHSVEFDLFTDDVEPSSSGRASFVASPSSSVPALPSQAPLQVPNFMDDLLIPQQAAPLTPHQPDPYQQSQQSVQQRRSISRDPSSVLSLFDQPAPEKPPKPVMLNTPSNMMSMGPMGGNRGMSGPGQQHMGQQHQMQSPVMQQQFSPAGSMGGPMSGGRGPIPGHGQGQPGGFFSPAPSPQQQFVPGAQRVGAYPVIQTNKTLDPFDSINNHQQHFSGKQQGGRR